MLTTITMTEIKNPAHVRKDYEKEFKLRLCKEIDAGATQAEVYRKYQVPQNNVSRWYKDWCENGEMAFVGRGRKKSVVSSENARTYKQVAALKAAREAMRVAAKLSRERDRLVTEIKELLASVG